MKKISPMVHGSANKTKLFHSLYPSVRITFRETAESGKLTSVISQGHIISKKPLSEMPKLISIK